MEKAIAADEPASALESPRGRDLKCCTNSEGGVGVETEISKGRFDLRKRGITKVNEQIKLMIGLALRLSAD